MYHNPLDISIEMLITTFTDSVGQGISIIRQPHFVCVCGQMLQQGFPPDSCDYDKRTGLMLASTRGHIPVVELLLAAGAPVDQVDSFGQTALSEACKFGQEETIAVLRRAGAK